MNSSGAILLAEDNPDDIFLVRLGFKKAAFEVPIIVVTDGGEAIRYLKGEGDYSDRSKFPIPRLMLLDLNLPGQSGFEVLAWVRQRPQWKCLPIIVLTSSHSGKDIERSYDLGANSFLTKPADLEEWMLAVKQTAHFWLNETRLPEPGPFLPVPAGDPRSESGAKPASLRRFATHDNPKVRKPLLKRSRRSIRG